MCRKNLMGYGMRLTRVSLAILMFGAFSSYAQAESKEVKIGNILPLSGPSASVGVEGKNMREFVINKFNAEGGLKCDGALNGSKIKMIYLDTKSQPTVGVSDVQQLINQDHVDLLTGAWNSGVTYPATQISEMNKIPFIVPVSVMARITERGYKYVFRIAAKNTWQGKFQFDFIDQLARDTGKKIETLGLVYVNSDYGKSYDETWIKLAKEHGYKVVLDQAYGETATDLTPVVLKMKSVKPDVVLLVSNVSDAILLQNTMASYDVRPLALIGVGGGHSDAAFIKNTGANSEYLFHMSQWAKDANKPSIKVLNQSFKKSYGSDVNADTLGAYVAMHTIIESLQKTCSTDPDKLREAMVSTEFKGGPFSVMPASSVKFDEQGQNIRARLVMVQIKKVGNKLERVTVYPEENARAGFKPVYPRPNHY
jgi:branched-chain amino acid transport system substrate-binding protein